MPLQFQQQLVCNLLVTHGVFADAPDTAKIALHWFVEEWRNWFDRHREKRDKMFIYREKAAAVVAEGDEDDDTTMPDPENLEIQALFPDFSREEVDFEFFFAAKAPAVVPGVTSRLPDAQDIRRLVQLLYNPQSTGPVDQSDAFLAVMWLVGEFNHTDAIENLLFSQNGPVDTSALLDYHLLLLAEFRKSLGTKAIKKKFLMKNCFDNLH
uniref:Nuclear pore complex protein n=1 Tax=Panagrellus redivivus TaxID=6233 RepID=A0A7E4V835_PANRE